MIDQIGYSLNTDQLFCFFLENNLKITQFYLYNNHIYLYTNW